MKPVHIIGVPLDLGGNRRGVDMGPSAFRIAGLGEQHRARSGYAVVDKGDLPAPIPETQRAARRAEEVHPRHRARSARSCTRRALASLEEGAMPLVLGGDHSLARRLGGGGGRVGAADAQTCRSACSGWTRTAT